MIWMTIATWAIFIVSWAALAYAWREQNRNRVAIRELTDRVDSTGVINQVLTERHDFLIRAITVGSVTGETNEVRAWCALTLKDLEML